MGRLIYNSTTQVSIDDRILAHLQIVIGAKLRRGESFYFSWKDPDRPIEHETLWLTPNTSLHYKYHESRLPTINRAWVVALAATSNAGGGLHLVAEPPDTGQDEDGDRR